MKTKSLVMSVILAVGLMSGCGGIEGDMDAPATGEVQAQDVTACERACFNAFRICTYDATTPEDGEACAEELRDCRFGPNGCTPSGS